MKSPGPSAFSVKGKRFQQPEASLPTKSHRHLRGKAQENCTQRGKGHVGTWARRPQRQLRVSVAASSSASSPDSLFLSARCPLGCHQLHRPKISSPPTTSLLFPYPALIFFFMAQTIICDRPVRLLVSLCLSLHWKERARSSSFASGTPST